MKNLKKNALKSKEGITLIALVITIIVLLILAGVSIAMLSGDNSTLQRATDAKEKNGIVKLVESAKLDVLAQLTENKGNDISKDQLKSILNIYFEDIENLELPNDLSNSDIKLNANQAYGSYQNIALKDIYSGVLSSKSKTIGEEYNDSWIGKSIDYSSNGVSDWIILGQDDSTKDVLITTAYAVGSYTTTNTLIGWYNYKDDVDGICSAYTGNIGNKNIAVKGARSITLKDINKAVGFNEIINPVIVTQTAYPNESFTDWIMPTDSGSWIWTDRTYGYYYFNDSWIYTNGLNDNDDRVITLSNPSNMKYINADGQEYFTSDRTVSYLYSEYSEQWISTFEVGFYDGSSVSGSIWNGDGRLFESYKDSTHAGVTYTAKVRPVVIIPASVLLDDVSIDDYWTY